MLERLKLLFIVIDGLIDDMPSAWHGSGLCELVEAEAESISGLARVGRGKEGKGPPVNACTVPVDSQERAMLAALTLVCVLVRPLRQAAGDDPSLHSAVAAAIRPSWMSSYARALAPILMQPFKAGGALERMQGGAVLTLDFFLDICSPEQGNPATLRQVPAAEKLLSAVFAEPGLIEALMDRAAEPSGMFGLIAAHCLQAMLQGGGDRDDAIRLLDRGLIAKLVPRAPAWVAAADRDSSASCRLSLT